MSVRPTVASVDWPKPLKMSLMPQIPKLMIKTPITTAMMILPSQFDEAFRIPRSMGPTFLAGGNRLAPKRIRYRIPQKGVTELISIIKWQPPRRNLDGEGQLNPSAARRCQGRYLELAPLLC